MEIDIKIKMLTEVDTTIFHCVHIVTGEGSWVLLEPAGRQRR